MIYLATYYWLVKRMVLQVTGLDADAYGADHIWCMIVADDYNGLD